MVTLIPLRAFPSFSDSTLPAEEQLSDLHATEPGNELRQADTFARLGNHESNRV